MLFTKNPRLMNQDEICGWVLDRIVTRSPESRFLDYKESISLDKTKNKIELGKDVTSFANQNGGVLLYGIPEVLVDGVPVPADISKCGMEIDEKLPQQLENILIDTIQPSLPEIFINIVNLNEIKPKSILMIYHPESWNKPHMIESYEHRIYYCRGEYRAIKMNEKQIESAYLSRQVSFDRAQSFFKSGSFLPMPEGKPYLRATICPRYLINKKDIMYASEFKEWLDTKFNSGEWRTFIDGWRLIYAYEGSPHLEFRIFHNGAVSLTSADTWVIIQDGPFKGCIGIPHVMDLLKRLLNKVINLYNYLLITGPLYIEFILENMKGLRSIIGKDIIERNTLRFIEETSFEELRFNEKHVIDRLESRFSSAFGKFVPIDKENQSES